MTVARTVARNSLVQLAGRGITMAVSLGTLSLLSRYLGPEDFGKYQFVISFLLLVNVSDFGVATLAVRHLSTSERDADDLMGNVIVGVPIGGTYGAAVKPFVTAGIGLLRTQIDGGTLADVSSSNNMLGWNAGAGVMGYFNNHVGLRGDIRYLRGFKDLNTGNTVIDLSGNNNLRFWRLSAGVVLK